MDLTLDFTQEGIPEAFAFAAAYLVVIVLMIFGIIDHLITNYKKKKKDKSKY